MAQSVIGALRVNLGLDAAQFRRGAREAEGIASRLGRQMQTIGAAVSVVGAGIALAIRGQINAADDLAKAARRIGIPVEALSQLQHAASLSGVELGNLQSSMQRMARAMVDDADAFTRIGVAVRGADGQMRPMMDVLQDVADVIAGMPEGAERTALAMELMGRSGAEMIPMLVGGGDAIRGMMEEADRLGLTLTQDAAEAAERFNDNLTRLGAVATGLARQIATALTPVLESMTNAMVAVSASFADMTPATRTFVAGAAAAVVAIGPLLIAVGTLTRAMAALRLASFAALGPWGLLAGIVATAAAAFVGFNRDTEGTAGTVESVAAAQDELNRALGVFSETGAPSARADALALARTMEAEALAALSAAQSHRELMMARVQAAEGFGDGGESNPMIGRIRDDLAQSEARILEILAQLDNARRTARGLSVDVGGAEDPLDDAADAAEGLAETLERTGSAAGQAANVEIPEMAKALEDAADAAGELQSSFESAFVNAITGTQGLRGALAGLARDLARMAAQSAFRGMFGNMFGGGGGGFLSGLAGLFSVGPRVSMPTMPSFAGGGYTGSGARAGGLDGRGGFLAMMHPQETVSDHTRGGGGRAAPVININVNGARGNGEIMEMVQAGVSQGLQEYDRSVLPESVQRVSADPMRRG